MEIPLLPLYHASKTCHDLHSYVILWIIYLRAFIELQIHFFMILPKSPLAHPPVSQCAVFSYVFTWSIFCTTIYSNSDQASKCAISYILYHWIDLRYSLICCLLWCLALITTQNPLRRNAKINVLVIKGFFQNFFHLKYVTTVIWPIEINIQPKQSC